VKARVYRSSNREFDCRLESSGEMVRAKAEANLLKRKENIVVGDYVELEKIESTDEWKIKIVDPRDNEIYRLLVRESRKKVTAANCNYLVIVSSSSKPEFKRGFVDRFLVRAFQWGLTPLVVFNKMDEYLGDDFDIIFENERLSFLEHSAFELSAKFESYQKKYLQNGIEELKELLKGKTSLFVGQSGVGKSQLISTLAGEEIELKTNKIARSGKGSHTTTWSEIIDCGDFATIDSPGIRSLSLEDIDPTDLMHYFPDLEPLALNCKFNNCEHLENSKGCQFFEVDREEGVLSRLESYNRFYEELSALPFWSKKW